MTATRERPSAPSPDLDGAPEWAERSAFGSFRGVPWWSALLIALVPTALGTAVDCLIWSQPRLVYMAAFFVGCVIAVTLVRRASLFGPMVQPPLILVISMPAVTLLVGRGRGGGAAGTALNVATPLINSFPVMAATSAIVVGIGLLRMFHLQPAKTAEDEPDPDGRTKLAKAPKRSGDGKGKASESAKRPPREQRPDKRRSGSSRDAASQGRGRPTSDGQRGRGQTPGRPRGGEPPRGSTPPGRGSGPRPAPGRGRPRDDRRRRPRNDDEFF